MIDSLESRRLFAASYPFLFGGGGFDNAQKTVVTPDGGTIVTGLFSGTTDFAGPGARKPAVLTARGDTDIFVASYAASGNLNWAIRAGGEEHTREMSRFTRRDIQVRQNRFTQFIGRIGGQPTEAGEYVNDMAVDSAGNIYLAGAFRQTFTAGRFTLTANDEFTNDFYDALVLKISPSGTVTWARQFGGAFDDDALTIAIDGFDKPTFGGYYSREADFDPSDDEYVLRTTGRDAGFVARLTEVGELSWAYQFESDSIRIDERNAVNDIAVTRRGDVYFAGTFAAAADFEPGEREYVIEAKGRTDAVLGRLNQKGALRWAQSTGGDDYDGNSAVALDNDGNVYTAGYFSEEADVDPRPGVERVLEAASLNSNSPDFSDLLVSRVDSMGNPVWQGQIGGPYIELIADLAVASSGDIVLAGSFFNSIDVAPGRGSYILKSTLSNAGSIKDRNTDFGRNETYDWFAVTLSPRGKFVNGARFGDADDDYAAGLTILANNTLLLSGRVVNSRTTTDREDRQEQSLIELLSPELKRVVSVV